MKKRYSLLLPDHKLLVRYVASDIYSVQQRKPIGWLHGEIKTPPFSREARIEAGKLLGKLQCGVTLSMPDSRPLPSIGSNCHELRIDDGGITWRILVQIRSEAILVLDVFAKKSEKIPKHVLDAARRRLKSYERKEE